MLDTVAARKARKQVLAACASGLDHPTLLREVSDALSPAVAFDAAGWMPFDPGTMLPTGGHVVGMTDEVVRAFFENEFTVPDVNKVRELVRARRSAALLSDATGGDLERSPRYRTMLAPLGHEHELRLPFIVDGDCWGSVCLVRDGAREDFTRAEVDFVAALARHIAQGLRVAVATAAAQAPTGADDRPGMLVVADDHTVVSASAEAERWIDELDAGWSRFGSALPAPVHSAITLARTCADGGSAAPPRVRVRTRADRWLVVHASALYGPRRQWGVVIEPARRPEVLPLIAAAHGLTAREREVFGMLLRGTPDKEIARALVVSDHTAREHARRVLRKLGARNRTDLVVRVLAEQQDAQPRLLESGACPPR